MRFSSGFHFPDRRAAVDDQAMQVQVNTRTSGTLGFGKGSVCGADLRVSMSTRQKGAGPPYRVVAEGRNAYVTNAGIAKTRSWVHAKTSGRETAFSTWASLRRACNSC
ncbi:hypothetical protein FXF51_17480 [Nonomuraea sp. PA05]|uniref:hypothetical protein n=1 Tax=Nonomuraea sp. PA05 TaxID=2604466 RepID=UPI0011DB3265|nr:hypothetical protein [Nonomuraea sp. PA05]TYB65993.1 hypothetical protein FXF51_17480 [Nonomuraea sp. PA05]